MSSRSMNKIWLHFVASSLFQKNEAAKKAASNVTRIYVQCSPDSNRNLCATMQYSYRTELLQRQRCATSYPFNYSPYLMTLFGSLTGLS
jgi:hypothetical protein